MKKKLIMVQKNEITREEGCVLYLENFRQRNLQEESIRHYRDCYVQFKTYFSADMPLGEMTEKVSGVFEVPKETDGR